MLTQELQMRARVLTERITAAPSDQREKLTKHLRRWLQEFDFSADGLAKFEELERMVTSTCDGKGVSS